jgi:hypothetical protein
MPDRDPKARRRLWYGQTVAYVLIMGVVLWGFWVQSRIQADLCNSSYENRVAIRNLSAAISTLGEHLVLGNKPDPGHITPEQKASLKQFRDFRKAQAKALDLPTCD